MISPLRCADCGLQLVDQAVWRDAPLAQRETLRTHQAHGLCTRCYKKNRRLGTLAQYGATTQDHRERRELALVHAVVKAAGVTPFPNDVDIPCRDDSVDPDWFYSYNDEDVELAKSICRNGADGTGCPVKALCLRRALESREPCGVFGGEVVRHGKVVPYQRERYDEAMTGQRRGDPRQGKHEKKEVA